MTNKIIIILKTIGRKWFIFLVVAILITALYNQTAAIVITVISISLFILSYIPSFYLKYKLIKFMKEYYRIDDITVAKYFKKPIEKIQNKMYKLSQKQTRIEWLIIFLEKHYIFYHMLTIEKFKELYIKGFGDKEILENMKEFELKTRGEIKAIEETLIRYERLAEREISVKEREEKKRFDAI